MLKAILYFSLRYRAVVVFIAFAFLAFGLSQLRTAQYDVFPEFASSLVNIQTEAPGLSPEQVELLVTQPIENAVNGLPAIDSMRSSSIQGLSVITLIFKEGGSIYQDRQVVSERIAGLSSILPLGARAPIMSPLTSSSGDLMSIGITSSKLTLQELRTLVDWSIKPRLLAVPGVAKVGIFGGLVKQLQIQLHPKKLIELGLSIEDVIAVAQKVIGIRGAGFIDTTKQRITIQTDGQLATIKQLSEAALIKLNSDVPVSATIGDVADIIEGHVPPLSMATVNGQPGIVLNIWAQFQANMLRTSSELDLAIKEMQPDLEKDGIKMDASLFRAERFVFASLHNIESALKTGAILVVIVLMFFLYNWRTALISCIAIPLSLIGASTVLQFFGYSLNTMTLGGLAIALGEVVDDAVIDVENIIRRLRMQINDPDANLRNIIFSASLEVRSAVVFGTFAVCLVFIPVLTMGGVSGSLFAPLGISYILAILFSLIVALTITPALCSLLLSPSNISHHEPYIVGKLRALYEKVLALVEKLMLFVVLLMLVGLIFTLYLIPKLHGEFLPKFRENHYIAHLTASPGASLEESVRIGDLATIELKKLSWVRSVAQRAGRAAADDTFSPNVSELEIDLEQSSPKESQSIIRRILNSIPGIEVEVNSFFDERIDETVSGTTAPVVIHVFGKELDSIDARADEISKIIESISGAVDVKINSPVGAPKIYIKLRPEELLKWGLETTTVLDAISIAFQGANVGQIYDGNRVYGVAVTLAQPESEAEKIENLKSLPIQNPVGTYVQLNKIADILLTQGRSEIPHEQAQRSLTITCNVENRSLQSFIAEVRTKISSTLIDETTVTFEGAAEAQSEAQMNLLIHSAIAVLGIILLLSIVMGKISNLILVLANLPMALIGGVLAAYFSGQALSMGTLVGFVTLFGITLRNSIMMISHYRHLVIEEGMEWNAETSIIGASERLVPILMTALVTGLGLLPLALHPDVAGQEIEGPMSIVILGGLFSSTFLNLFILPALSARYANFSRVSELTI